MTCIPNADEEQVGGTCLIASLYVAFLAQFSSTRDCNERTREWDILTEAHYERISAAFAVVGGQFPPLSNSTRDKASSKV
jgi:hypothetical protein